VSAKRLKSGDAVLHPTFGMGVVEGIATQDHDGKPTRYYNIRLAETGLLSVPVSRASTLGLRRAVNGLHIIATRLHTPAELLPDDARARILELGARWRAPEPHVLIEAVRDLVARGRSRTLSPADKKWLFSAQERLSAEAALVDDISLDEARSAIQRELDELKQAGDGIA
jgi:RNA polymerase-interacting CarD/CdnL/TRCF family regulator